MGFHKQIWLVLGNPHDFGLGSGIGDRQAGKIKHRTAPHHQDCLFALPPYLQRLVTFARTRLGTPETIKESPKHRKRYIRDNNQIQ